jgi:beta-N-acetylhexosaminidase
LPVVNRSLDELHSRELVPFAAAIEAGCRVIMTSHVLLPQLDPNHPATMSPSILQDLLRGELNFPGVIVSDALDMAGASGSVGMAEAAVTALRAGCDLLCLGTDNTDAQLAEIEYAVNNALGEGTLASSRVSDAVSRVRGLAADLELAGAAAGEPPGFAPSAPMAEAELIRTFDLQPRAADWRARASGRYAVVRLESDPNIAVGHTPWGPFAVLPAHLITPDESVLPSFERDQPVLVIGRDIHRHPFARKAVDGLRSEHADVLVVDMGWPSDDRRYADVATFGASLLIGRALLEWVAS